MQASQQRGQAGLSPAPGSAVALVVAASLAVLAAPASSAAARERDRPIVVRASQTVAVLRTAEPARAAPRARSRVLQLVTARRPLTGERTVLPVIGRRVGARGVRWLHVLLPGRPNGHAGWIRRRSTALTRTSWHIVVDTSSRRLSVYWRGRRMRAFRAVVGKPATPTPRGAFFVEEVVRLRRADVGAPFALALSARSEVLQEFDGGPGQIAVHGLANVGGVLGSAASHGCIRVAGDATRWLVARIGPGVPVTIDR